MKIPILLLLTLMASLTLGCTKHPLNAPCDDYGQHCEPKVAINQWTA